MRDGTVLATAIGEGGHRGDRRAAGHVLLAGGGTGGHVFPGLAIAEELQRRRWRVSWLGRKQGMESDLLSLRGIPYHGLPARPFVGQGLARRGLAMTTAAVSALRAGNLLRAKGVDAVLGTGGYVCAPAVLGARLSRKPSFLLEPNAHAGKANQWLSRWSDKVFLGYESTAAAFDTPTLHSGVPVRSAFFAASELPAAPPRLLVLGGSQGAREINRLMPPLVELLAARLPGLTVLHQAGQGHFASVEEDYASRALGEARVETAPFLEDVASAMAEAHLIVSRAGALTLAEICAAGRPSLLLPLSLAGGHQRANADGLVAAGAAEILDLAVGEEGVDSGIGPVQASAAAERVFGLLKDREKLESMAAAAHSLARPDAAAAIAEELIESVGGGGA